jgi:hypothetical protein
MGGRYIYGSGQGWLVAVSPETEADHDYIHPGKSVYCLLAINIEAPYPLLKRIIAAVSV